ncbi:MAG: hypothetical protein ACW96U_00040 [Candidatus Heimdallarchaeaceae archaeon]|jgi:hypothetical protein
MRVKAKGNKTSTVVKALAIPDIIEVNDADLSNAELQALITDAVPIDDFVGFVEMLVADLSNTVPSSFPRSSKNIGTEETPNIVQKTWDEYTVHKDDGTDAIMLIGFRNAAGNRPDGVKWAEFQEWVTEFGASEILTLSEGKTLLQTKYAEEE